VESIPGPNAAMAALADSGLASDTFTFLGFPPARSKARADWFARAKAIGGTVVFYEAPHRIRQTLTDLHRLIGDRSIVICRELTKAHEELVRGPIMTVLEKLQSPLGEFTVVADIGHSTDYADQAPPSDEDISAEFGEMTNTAGLTRRAAVSALAKRHGIRPNAVYAMVERGKK
jgi:16S rRNA (cytidine1402-2'-O)-methyltransferase